MSEADEIIFGEVAYREPVRLRRPDRDPRKAAIAYEVPSPDDLPIFLERRPADQIERHALRDTSVELGGILLGKECADDETGEPFVLITEALEAKHFENTEASFTYTHESWEEISRERDEKFPDLDIVGWYHTHPDFGVFLSNHDLFIHHHFFAQRLQVAYVVDPVRQSRGFFQWKDGQVRQVRGFFISADRGDRQPLARLVNDLEGLPNAEGVGSGLSPRLEAELIAMLSRPQHAPPPVDRTQTAALFSLLGALVGAIIVALLLWVYTLGQSLRQQQSDLHDLAKSQQEATQQLGEAVRGAGTSAKERALDAILDRVRIADSSESIRQGYTDTMQEVVGLQDQVARLETEKEALHEHSNQLQNRLDSASEELIALREKASQAEQTLQENEHTINRLQAELGRQKGLLDEGGGLAASRGNLTFWAALGGWLAFLLAMLGMVALWYRLPDDDFLVSGEPIPSSDPPSPSSPDDSSDESTHRIG